MALGWIFLRRDILGFSQFLCAKFLVSIPSYVYFLDGYNQGVGEGASQKYALGLLANLKQTREVK